MFSDCRGAFSEGFVQFYETIRLPPRPISLTVAEVTSSSFVVLADAPFRAGSGIMRA